MLGFDISERTVSRLMPKPAPNPDLIRKWKAFLKNHSHDIAAMAFFTVPTLCFRVLYVLVIMRHHRRQIVHVNVTANPTTEWVKQQIKDAFSYDEAPSPRFSRGFGILGLFRKEVRLIVRERIAGPMCHGGSAEIRSGMKSKTE